ncbi:deoxyribose-phosphate aldolase [Desulfuromonas carbonis]
MTQAASLLYGSGSRWRRWMDFPSATSRRPRRRRKPPRHERAGAGEEIDMVIHLGAVREGRFDAVTQEIRQVVRAARGAVVKVIIECCYLGDDQKRTLVDCVVAGGAAYVKTSTGFGSGGATLDDVRLLVTAAAGRIQVKAAGGIRDWSACQPLLAAGATRIGTKYRDSHRGQLASQAWEGAGQPTLPGPC